MNVEMKEKRDYTKYRTICPLPPECIKKYEEELRPLDGEMRVMVFGREYKTSRKGKILKLCDFQTRKITSLSQIEGLERLTELSTLDLSNQNIQDISGLTHLKGLRNLYLSGNKGVDLKPLENLQSLEKLVLYSGTYPKNVKSIGKLKNKIL